jgi:hypothetical protein
MILGESHAQTLNRFVRVPVLGIIFTLCTLLYSREFNWPDYYHIEYGLPMAWLLRTMSTIIGPVDKLEFQPVPFLIDWFFWSLLALILLFVVDRFRPNSSGHAKA